ncbi:MAG: beta-ketoacyl synthase N-terminal-like domain-containing protein [Pseudonocardiaceae bacterium]
MLTSYIDYLESLSKKQLMVMLARQRQEENQGIAVVGMGCRLPGRINDPQSLWSALREGRVVPTESVGTPTDSLGRPRWNLNAPDLTPLADLLSSGAYLDDIDVFDAGYFGIPDAEALHMDPQQRILLEVTVAALADANLTRAQLRRRQVGIFVGANQVEYPFAWLRNGLSVEEISPYMGTGSASSVLSGRIGSALGVSGPAISIDSASSTMLSAVHLAAVALRRRECEVAIVGACNLVLSPLSTSILAQAGMLSPTGRCRPFTADADGHVRAEGCGVVVLKRHNDAIADGDLPYAVIRGSAVHQHGDRPGISVASASGQQAVIELALRRAGVDSLDVQYVEAQANGSRLGGIIEAESVAEAYRRRVSGTPSLYLGSCKANLGYLETASGAPGLMKTVLALAHGEIPPQVGEDNLDPTVTWDRMGLRFAAKPLPWPSQGRRRAGVSAFGFSGTAAHVVLENVTDPPGAEVCPAGPALLVVSAHNDAALAATAGRLCSHLEDRADWDHAAVCRTLAEGRDQLAVRHAAVVGDRTALLAELGRVAGGGSVPRLARHRTGVVVELAELGAEQLRSALLAGRRAGFEALDTRIRARADAMDLTAVDGFLAAEEAAPPGWALAWALGWLDLLATVGLDVVGGRFEGPHRAALVDLVTGRRDSDEICARWLQGTVESTPAAPNSWELTATTRACTLRRPGASVLNPTSLAELDVAGWLDLVVEEFLAGADLTFSALSPHPRRGLCRLPGPVLTGRSYWPDHNIWC